MAKKKNKEDNRLLLGTVRMPDVSNLVRDEVFKQRSAVSDDWEPSKELLDAIKSYEKFSPVVYKDGNGVETIGYGTTDKKIIAKYRGGKRMSKREAERLFNRHVDDVIAQMKDSIPNFSSMSNNQKDAMTSYVYNVGIGGVTRKSPKLMEALEKKNWKEAARQMDFGYNDEKNSGLRKRRDEEQALFTAYLDMELEEPTEEELAAAHAQMQQNALEDILSSRNALELQDPLRTDFNEAYRIAVERKQPTFTWNGREFATDLKAEGGPIATFLHNITHPRDAAYTLMKASGASAQLTMPEIIDALAGLSDKNYTGNNDGEKSSFDYPEMYIYGKSEGAEELSEEEKGYGVDYSAYLKEHGRDPKKVKQYKGDFGADIILPESIKSYLDEIVGTDKNFTMGYTDVSGTDDVAGHLGRINKDKNGEYIISYSDLWDFEPESYTKDWAAGNLAQKGFAYTQAWLLDKIGNPFIVRNNKKVKFIPDSEYDNAINELFESDEYIPKEMGYYSHDTYKAISEHMRNESTYGDKKIRSYGLKDALNMISIPFREMTNRADGGPTSPEEEQDIINRVNQSKADFIQRLLNGNLMSIPDWEKKGNISTHKLRAEIDEDGNAIVFPIVQNIDGKLYDFSDPANGRSFDNEDYVWRAMDSAISRGDTVRFNNIGEAIWFADNNYKKFYDSFQKPDGGPVAPRDAIQPPANPTMDFMNSIGEGIPFDAGTLPEVVKIIDLSPEDYREAMRKAEARRGRSYVYRSQAEAAPLMNGLAASAGMTALASLGLAGTTSDMALSIFDLFENPTDPLNYLPFSDLTKVAKYRAINMPKGFGTREGAKKMIEENVDYAKKFYLDVLMPIYDNGTKRDIDKLSESGKKLYDKIKSESGKNVLDVINDVGASWQDEKDVEFILRREAMSQNIKDDLKNKELPVEITDISKGIIYPEYSYETNKLYIPELASLLGDDEVRRIAIHEMRHMFTESPIRKQEANADVISNFLIGWDERKKIDNAYKVIGKPKSKASLDIYEKLATNSEIKYTLLNDENFDKNMNFIGSSHGVRFGHSHTDQSFSETVNERLDKISDDTLLDILESTNSYGKDYAHHIRKTKDPGEKKQYLDKIRDAIKTIPFLYFPITDSFLNERFNFDERNILYGDEDKGPGYSSSSSAAIANNEVKKNGGTVRDYINSLNDTDLLHLYSRATDYGKRRAAMLNLVREGNREIYDLLIDDMRQDIIKAGEVYDEDRRQNGGQVSPITTFNLEFRELPTVEHIMDVVSDANRESMDPIADSIIGMGYVPYIRNYFKEGGASSDGILNDYFKKWNEWMKRPRASRRKNSFENASELTKIQNYYRREVVPSLKKKMDQGGYTEDEIQELWGAFTPSGETPGADSLDALMATIQEFRYNAFNASLNDIRLDENVRSAIDGTIRSMPPEDFLIMLRNTNGFGADYAKQLDKMPDSNEKDEELYHMRDVMARATSYAPIGLGAAYYNNTSDEEVTRQMGGLVQHWGDRDWGPDEPKKTPEQIKAELDERYKITPDMPEADRLMMLNLRSFQEGGELSNEYKVKYLYDLLLNEAGMSQNQALAVLGNLWGESHWSESASGDTNTSYGIQQWHGDRRKKLIEFAKNRSGNEDPTFWDQAHFLVKEYREGQGFLDDNSPVKLDGYLSYSKSDFQNAESLHDAVVAWNQGFGRPHKKVMRTEDRYKGALKAAEMLGITVDENMPSFYGINGISEDPIVPAFDSFAVTATKPSGTPAATSVAQNTGEDDEDIPAVPGIENMTQEERQKLWFETYGKQMVEDYIAEENRVRKEQEDARRLQYQQQAEAQAKRDAEAAEQARRQAIIEQALDEALLNIPGMARGK